MRQQQLRNPDVARHTRTVSVLLEAEKLIEHDNSASLDPERALELAAGRFGLTIDEYRRMVEGDDELVAIHAKFMRAHAH